MKNGIKFNVTKFSTMLLLAGNALVLPATAAADVSANFGWVSEYIFRGVPQSDSSAYVGLDYQHKGFYVGTWAADVGDGSEVDLYFGYNGEIMDELTYSVGATGYYYTDDFDDTYQEVNLGLGYKWLSINANFGEYDNFDGPTQDYGFVTLGGEYKGFFARVGSFSNDFEGEYYEAGFGSNVAGLDLSLTVVHSTADLIGNSDTSIVFGIGKSIDLMSWAREIKE